MNHMIDLITFNVRGKEIEISPLYATPTIITAVNGGGKTSILECIMNHHQGDYKCLKDVNITYKDDEPIVFDLYTTRSDFNTYEDNIKVLIERLKQEQVRLKDYDKSEFKSGMKELLKVLELGYYKPMPFIHYLAQRMNKPYDKRCVSMIDCPEQGLHIYIQRYLSDILTLLFPNDQFIFTTHSPAFIPDDWYNVFFLR